MNKSTSSLKTTSDHISSIQYIFIGLLIFDFIALCIVIQLSPFNPTELQIELSNFKQHIERCQRVDLDSFFIAEQYKPKLTRHLERKINLSFNLKLDEGNLFNIQNSQTNLVKNFSAADNLTTLRNALLNSSSQYSIVDSFEQNFDDINATFSDQSVTITLNTVLWSADQCSIQVSSPTLTKGFLKPFSKSIVNFHVDEHWFEDRYPFMAQNWKHINDKTFAKAYLAIQNQRIEELKSINIVPYGNFSMSGFLFLIIYPFMFLIVISYIWWHLKVLHRTANDKKISLTPSRWLGITKTPGRYFNWVILCCAPFFICYLPLDQIIGLRGSSNVVFAIWFFFTFICAYKINNFIKKV
ncbi:hypothetical protein F9K33_12510 [bacterium]|nr:MAG: hypothetical protein F9K33_12510 [bacterium]